MEGHLNELQPEAGHGQALLTKEGADAKKMPHGLPTLKNGKLLERPLREQGEKDGFSMWGATSTNL